MKRLITFLFLFCSLEGNLSAQTGVSASSKPSSIEPGSSVVVAEFYIKGQENSSTAKYSIALARLLADVKYYLLIERDEAVSRLNQTLITPVKRVQDEKMKEIDDLVKKGDELLYTDPKAAVNVLNQAREQLKEIMESMAINSKVRTDFLKTQLLLVQSHIDNNNEKKALELLSELISVYGSDLDITAKDYHPKLVKLYEKQAGKMMKEKDALLSVATKPAGCDVIINGKNLGVKSPTDFLSMYAGAHYLSVSCGEKESLLRKVALERKKKQAVEIDVNFEYSLQKTREKLGFLFENVDDMKNNIGGFSANLGRLLNADYVIVTGFVPEGGGAVLKAFAVKTSSGEGVRTASTSAEKNFVSDTAVKNVFDGLTREIKEVEAASKQPVIKEEAAGKAWYKNWIGWTLIGAGAGSAVAGSIYLSKFFTHKSHAEDPDYGGDPYEEKDKAETARTLSGVFFGVGAAAIAGGVLVFVLSDSGGEVASSENGFIAYPVLLDDGGGFGAHVGF